MDRRKKGSGQITWVDEPNRKSKWKATVTDHRGKRKTRYFATEKAAKAFLREINADTNKMKALMEEGVSFTAFAEVFLEEKKKSGMKPGAYETLTQSVRRVEGKIGAVQLRDIDSDLVQQMIYELAEEGYSESVLTKAKIVVGSILKLAAAKHFLETVPVFEITIPARKKVDQEKQVKNNWMRDNEIASYEAECRRTYVPGKYTKYAGQERLVHIAGYKLLFLLHTGLRLGEALALTWSDYDEGSKTILVDKNLSPTKEGKIVQTPKTESGERVIILNRQAVADLDALRKQHEEQSEIIAQRRQKALDAAAETYEGDDLRQVRRRIREEFDAIEREHKYICGASTFPFGSSGHTSTKQTHDKICKDAGIPHKVTLHGLRHTYVTHYYIKHKNDPDFDLATFSKSIGHSSVRTTMEIYAHLDMTQSRYVARSLEDLKDF